MNTPAPAIVTATVLVVNVCYVALLVARMAASQRAGTATAREAGAVATQHVASRRATIVLVLMGGTTAFYYIALLVWLAEPDMVGPPIAAPSGWLYVAGLVCSVAGLALMMWTYRVFRSWRWRAEIDPGHRLMVEGPFKRVRHPIYLSFALFFAGSVMLLPYWVFLLHAVVSVIAYDVRARAEEAVMLEAFGDAYQDYRDRTSRYLPGVY